MMHELSLVQSLLKQVEEIRLQQSAARVTAVSVSVGEFSGVEPDLFHSAFDFQVAHIGWGNVTLQLDRVPLEAHCDDCEEQFYVEKFRFQCPHCHSRQVSITRGQELVLESVTVEHEEAVSS